MKKFILGIIAIFSVLTFNSGCSNGFDDGVYVGNYEEKTTWATYTANVEVTLKNGKLEEVKLLSSNIHSPESSWDNTAAWTQHYQELLDSYVGINARKIVDNDKAPVDSLSGATISSDRLYQAIKLALINGPR